MRDLFVKYIYLLFLFGCKNLRNVCCWLLSLSLAWVSRCIYMYVEEEEDERHKSGQYETLVVVILDISL